MPFKSEAQRRFMFARHPKIAKRWAAEYPESAKGNLPEHVAKKGLKRLVKKAKSVKGKTWQH